MSCSREQCSNAGSATPRSLVKHCCNLLIDFSLTVKAVTLIFISGRCSAISSARQGKPGSIYNLVKN